MNPKSTTAKKHAEQVIKDISRATRRHFWAEDTIRVVLDGLRGEDSIAELCRREGFAQSPITLGPRSSWKLASAVWRETPPAPPAAMT